MSKKYEGKVPLKCIWCVDGDVVDHVCQNVCCGYTYSMDRTMAIKDHLRRNPLAATAEVARAIGCSRDLVVKTIRTMPRRIQEMRAKKGFSRQELARLRRNQYA